MMRDFEFNKVERKVYPRTFLSAVFVIFEYDKIGEPDDLVPRVKQYIKDNFNLDVDLTGEDLNFGCSVDNDTAGFSYYFSRGSIGVKYFKGDYVSFTETMAPHVYRLITYVKNVLEMPSLSSAQIRKVNILNVKTTEGAQMHNFNLETELLSENLRLNAEAASGYMDLENPKKLKGIADGNEFEINYGIQHGSLPNGDEFVGLLLEEIITNSNVRLEDVDDKLREINEKLFDIFHWSISPNMLALMNNE